MAEEDYRNISIERDDGVTYLSLNRPEKRNAMSPSLHYEMEQAVQDLADDPETRVLVLTGAGDAWCAGQDIKLYFRETANNPAERKRSNAASHHWRWDLLSTFPKPTIAMVNGYCFGGAFTQLCAVDFVVTADEAIYGLSEVNWGIIPGGIVSWNLIEMMLPRHAMYYALTGEPFDGKRAVEVGLANISVPLDELRGATDKLARKMMALNPGVVAGTKDAIRAVKGMKVEQARDYLRAKQDSVASRDAEIKDRKGMSEFLDKKSYRPGLGPYARETEKG